MNTVPDRTTKSHSSRRALLIGFVVTLVAITLVLIGREGLRSHYEESRHYSSAVDIPAHNGLFVLPPWAPDDATDITINVQTQGKGRSMQFTSETGLIEDCIATPRPQTSPIPDLELPEKLEEAPGQRCQQWFVVSDDDVLYAWDAYAPAD